MAKKSVAAKDGLIDQREFRNALGRFATGITVITTRTPDGTNEGLTANSFSALSLDPPLVLWSLVNKSPSREGFLASGHFVINVLSSHQRHISNQFAAAAEDKFDGIDWHPGLGDCPILDDHLAVFECNIEKTVDGGDHLLFIGRVQRSDYREGNPLIFNGGKYCVTAELPHDPSQTAHLTEFTDLLLW